MRDKNLKFILRSAPPERLVASGYVVRNYGPGNSLIWNEEKLNKASDDSIQWVADQLSTSSNWR